MNETYVTIRGRLTADPAVRTTRTGAPMTTFRIAHSARRPVQGQPGQWEDTEASFYDVVTFRSLAANIAVSLRRGHPVTVHGKQRITSWQGDDGSSRTNVEVEADAVGHDLTFGTTAFARVGMGRPAESWAPSDGPGSQGDQPDGTDARAQLGDPDSDPYVVDAVPGRGLGHGGVGGGGGVGVRVGGADDAGSGGETSDAGADTGPLVRSGKEVAA
jgi:single-strand DNA-binding protein